MPLAPTLRHLTRHITTSMPRPRITLYVDTVSPFAYEAYYILRHNDVFKACDITYVPIFLGGLMHKCGNTAPVKIKNKDKWIATERLRWADHFAIPMARDLPPDFPAPTLPIMRALCVIADGEDGADPDAQQQQQQRLVKALDVFFAQHWVHGVATHKPEVLRETLVGLFGEGEAERILTHLPTKGKHLLIANTDRAFDDGAFGLPWLACTNSAGETAGFFGVDHLGQVAEFLGLERGEGRGWRALL